MIKLRSKIASVFRNDLFKNVLKLSSGTTIAHLITILISPILTRIFSPTDFGDLQFFQSLIIITSFFATGCYHFVLVSPKKETDTYALFKAIFTITVILSVISIVIGIVFVSNTILNQKVTLFLVFAFAVTLFANSLIMSFDYLFNRLERYSTISVSRVFRTSSSGLTQLIAGLAKYNNGLITGVLIGRIVTLGFYIWSLGLEIVKKIYSSSLSDAFIQLKVYKHQPLFILPSTAISMGSTEIVVFIIASLFGGYELGLYALAYRILSVPSAFIGSSVGEVFYKKSTDLINSKKSVQALTIRTWASLFGIAFLPCLILYLYGTEIIVFVFGTEWEVTGKIAEIIAPLILLNFVSAPTGKLFISLNDQLFSPFLSFLIFSARIGGLYLGFSEGSFLYAISLMVAFHLVALIISNSILYLRILKYEKLSVSY